MKSRIRKLITRYYQVPTEKLEEVIEKVIKRLVVWDRYSALLQIEDVLSFEGYFEPLWTDEPSILNVEKGVDHDKELERESY